MRLRQQTTSHSPWASLQWLQLFLSCFPHSPGEIHISIDLQSLHLSSTPMWDRRWLQGCLEQQRRNHAAGPTAPVLRGMEERASVSQPASPNHFLNKPKSRLQPDILADAYSFCMEPLAPSTPCVPAPQPGEPLSLAVGKVQPRPDLLTAIQGSTKMASIAQAPSSPWDLQSYPQHLALTCTGMAAALLRSASEGLKPGQAGSTEGAHYIGCDYPKPWPPHPRATQRGGVGLAMAVALEASPGEAIHAM